MNWMQRYRRSLSERGIAGSVRSFCGGLARTVRALAGRPVLRAEAFDGDDFDAKFGTDTSEARLSPGTVFYQSFLMEGAPYESPAPDLVSYVLKQLSIEHSQFRFVDLGSGKGRILLLASEFPFREIIGVEQQRALHLVATRNIARFRSPSQCCGSIRSVHGDARKVVGQMAGRPTVYFLNNPFHQETLRSVLENICASQCKEDSPNYIIYLYPRVSEELFLSFGFRVISEEQHFAIYYLPPCGSG